MTKGNLGRLQWTAVGIAILGGIAALINVWMGYQRDGTVDSGRIALAFGVPILVYGIVRVTSARRS